MRHASQAHVRQIQLLRAARDPDTLDEFQDLPASLQHNLD